MELKEKIGEFRSRFEGKDLKQVLLELHSEYGIDQKELGKIMVIVSITMMTISVYSITTLQGTLDDLESLNREFDRAQGVISSDSFQSSLDSLKQIKGSSIGRKAQTADEAFEQASQAMSKMEGTEKQLEHRVNMYKWFFLISILGTVGGAVTAYV